MLVFCLLGDIFLIMQDKFSNRVITVIMELLCQEIISLFFSKKEKKQGASVSERNLWISLDSCVFISPW